MTGMDPAMGSSIYHYLLQQGQWKAVGSLLDEAWYVDAGPELRFQRRMAPRKVWPRMGSANRRSERGAD